MRFASIAVLLFAAAVVSGCAGRAELIPNSDPALRKTAAEFAADAAKRHPYKADAPGGGQAKATAEVGYVIDRIDLLNTADTDFTDVEVWVNQDYVVFLPTLPAKKIVGLPFQALYNDRGQSFPISNGKLFNREPVLVNKIEIVQDGKRFDVPFNQAR
jgi:hypothetical protein